MIVFDLKCASGHIFEGWFGSGEDFDSQKESGLLLCPICDSHDVIKAVMAPAVPAKSNQLPEIRPAVRSEIMTTQQAEPSLPPALANMPQEKLAELMQGLAQAQAKALKDSEWVGNKFADQARAMHYGEEDHRAIHGEVDAQEARDLLEEGVEVVPLLFPVAPPGSRN
ncbi:MAG: DUF1178 family protein [Sphingobium sp.]|nr:DUF1178 family protein [Sphingobium sp.]